jgi:hypothetical protein
MLALLHGDRVLGFETGAGDPDPGAECDRRGCAPMDKARMLQTRALISGWLTTGPNTARGGCRPQSSMRLAKYRN